MPWIMDGEKIVVKDGHPVWKYEDGKESPIDFGATLSKLNEVTAESVSRKNKIREQESQLAILEGIEKPADWIKDAKKAMDTVKNLDDKKLVDAGEIERLKANLTEGFTKQLSEKDKKLADKDAAVRNLLIKGAFEGSEFIREKTVLPPGFAFDSFGRNFEVVEENGNIQAVAVRKNGDKIFSLKNPGSYATPDEAIEILVGEHPDKDKILKGNPGGGGTNPGNGKPLTPDMMKLPPAERINAARGIKN